MLSVICCKKSNKILVTFYKILKFIIFFLHFCAALQQNAVLLRLIDERNKKKLLNLVFLFHFPSTCGIIQLVHYRTVSGQRRKDECL